MTKASYNILLLVTLLLLQFLLGVRAVHVWVCGHWYVVDVDPVYGARASRWWLDVIPRQLITLLLTVVIIVLLWPTRRAGHDNADRRPAAPEGQHADAAVQAPENAAGIELAELDAEGRPQPEEELPPYEPRT